MTIPIRPRDTAALEQRVAVLEQAHVQLVARLAALEARSPRDQADQQLEHAIATATERLPFRSAQLLALARVTPELWAALLEVGLQTPDEVGAWLRDRKGTRHGIDVCRLRGRQWRVTYTSDT